VTPFVRLLISTWVVVMSGITIFPELSPGIAVTVYEMIESPPSLAGAVHVRFIAALPGVAARFIGSLGVVDGIA